MSKVFTRRHLLGWIGKIFAGIVITRAIPDWITRHVAKDPSHTVREARFVWPKLPGSLGGVQRFRAWVRKRGVGNDPTARVELHVAGVYRATVVPDTPVTSPEGEYFEGTWDATGLGVTGSSEVEMVVVTTVARGAMVDTADWNNTTTPHQWITHHAIAP